MNLQLFYAPTTCALVPYVALTEAGAQFQTHRIDMRRGQNRTPEYLSINPQHKVPALIADGHIVTENVAIQIFIARQFPAAKLLPTEPWDEIRAISLMSFFSSGIHPHLARINSPRKYCDMPGVEGAMRASAAAILAENFQIIDQMLSGRSWFFDHFTAVDAYFFWCFRRAHEFKLDLAAHGNCLAHYERMQERSSVKTLLAFEKDVLAGFAADVSQAT